MRKPLLAIAVCLALLTTAHAYVLQIDTTEFGRIVTIRWPSDEARSGISYVVNLDSFPFNSTDVLRIVDAGFSAWEDVPSAEIRFIGEGTGSFSKSATDRRNVILYDATGQEIGAPRGSGVIAITTINWDNFGNIIDTDIVFNGRDFDFSVSSTPNTSGGRIDMQDTMTHELGHLLGLDHTPLSGPLAQRPTMHPFASSVAAGRTLAQDDISGVTHLYPGPGASATGAIAGQVTHTDGDAAFGVHVVAYDPVTGAYAAGSLSGSAGDRKGRNGDGQYEIQGLPPGDYHVAIEPFPPDVSEDNIGGIFSNLESNVTKEYYDNAPLVGAARTIRVTAGQVTTDIDFALGLSMPGFPLVTGTALPQNTPDARGPYVFQVDITDNGSVVSAEVRFRTGGGAFETRSLTRLSGDRWEGRITGQLPGSLVEYRLIATDDDGNVTFLPAEDQPPLTFEVLSLSGSPMLYVVESESGLLSVIDSGSREEVARIPTGDTPHSVVMTPDQEVVFVANTGNPTVSGRTVTAISTSTHAILAQIVTGSGPLDMAMDAAGTRVFVTNSDGRSLSVIDVAGLTETRRINLSTVVDGPFGIAAKSDGSAVYVTDIGANRVLSVDPTTGRVTGTIDVVSSPRSLALSLDERTLYVAGFDGGIGIVNVTDGRQTRTISTAGGIFRVATSPTRDRLYATDHDNDDLLVFELPEGLLLNTIPVLFSGDNTRDVTVSDDGALVYVTNQDTNDLVVFDAETLSIVDSYRIGDGPRGIVIRTSPFADPIQVDEIAQADFDGNREVGFSDFLLFAAAFGASEGMSGFETRFDLDGDGAIGFSDFLAFAGLFGRSIT